MNRTVGRASARSAGHLTDEREEPPMSDRLEEVREALDRHPDFEPEGDAYRVTSTPFTVRLRFDRPDENRIEYTVEADLPSLEAAVADETISDTLLEGWAEPMERRLAGVDQATQLRDVAVSCTWDRDRFVATFRFERHPRGPAPTDEVPALAGYVEGTYLQSTIPGYHYRSPVGDLLEKARERAEGAGPP